MVAYRVFMLMSDRRMVGSKIIECFTDDEAMTVAPRFPGNHQAVEVWELERFVGRVELPHGPLSEPASVLRDWRALNEGKRTRAARR